MHKKNNLVIVLALVALMVASLACRGGAPATPTQPPQATQPVQAATPTQEAMQQNSGQLEIKSSSAYTDSFDDYNVAGEIVNNTNDTIDNIILSVSITDESGASLLKDDNDNPVDSMEVQPYIGVLVPGASAPFNYYISADEVKPAKFNVSIKSYDQSSAADPAEIAIENVQTTDTDGGDVLITGELINKTSQEVDVESLAGSVLNDADQVQAAGSSLTYSRYLAPAGDANGRDRTPFIMRLYGPIENATQWKVYARAVENTYPQDNDVEIQVTNSYMDAFGSYHLIGTLKNTGANQISPAVVGGLYSQDKTVFDAASLNIPLYLNPGESVPFDLNSFQVINTLPTDQANPADKVLQPDFYWTFTTDYDLVSLEATNVKVTPDGSGWTVSGTVVNTSDKKLGSISAVIVFSDGSQQVLTTTSTSIYPPDGADAIEPGTSNEFNVSLYVPQDWDLASKSYQVIVQGVVTE